MGENVYLCRYDPSDLKPIQDLDFIEAASVYPTRVKLSDFLQKKLNPSTGGSTTSSIEVEVVLHKGDVDGDQVAREIVQKTTIQLDDISVEHNKLRLTADANCIAQIEKIDAVKGIEERVKHKLYNNLARDDLNIDIKTNGEITTYSKYDGRGQIVAVSDTGFDTGSVTDPHPAFKGRVLALIPQGRKDTGETNDSHGHGTHVAGSVLGDGESSTMGGKIRGSAPGASLVMQSLLTEDGGLDTPLNLWDLFAVPYTKHKARISTNSWGPDWDMTRRQVEYDSQAGGVDRFVWHQQDHVIVFAAGNDGDIKSATNAHIGSSSAAKNCITVGATYSSRGTSGFYRYDPKVAASDPRKMAGFSSFGPTFERRIKPDVVAPGVAILSTSSRDPQNTKRTTFGDTKDRLWQFDTGTSIATPLVAGCCALLREALQANGTAQPSAALIKALIINSAVDLKLERTKQGFGRIYVDVGYPSKASSLPEGQTWTTEVTLPGDAQLTAKEVFKVTLVYYDRYGTVLQNKLSLKVKLAGGSTVEKRGDEVYAGLQENNVEQVAVKPKGTGYKKATITVTADRTARLDDTQAFAVVWGTYDE